jgi:amino acid adenylation domain-containing protein
MSLWGDGAPVEPMAVSTAGSPPSNQVYVFPASHAQRGLWFLDQLTPGSSLYNHHTSKRIRSALDVPALEASVNEIVRRHESLRTAFRSVDGEPVQVVVPRLHIPLPLIDVRDRPPHVREDEAMALADAQSSTPFDLANWPLLRTTLVRLDDDDHVLLLTMHHNVCDFWSLQIFQEELLATYAAFSAGRPSPLPEVPIQYADVSEWEREWLESPEGRSHIDYWTHQLADLPVLQLPTDRPRPEVPTYAGAGFDFEVPQHVHTALLRLGQEENASLFMIALAALQTLLFRYTGQEDVVVGTSVANRSRAGTEDIIGYLVNTLVLRTDLSGNPTFRQLLAKVRDMAMDAYGHQDVPFSRVVSELRPERIVGNNPLFQVHFQVFSDAALGSSERVLEEAFEADTTTAKFDLGLDLWEYDGLWGHVEYSTELFGPQIVEQLMAHLVRLLERIADDPDERIGDIPLLTEEELGQILGDWNDTSVPSSWDGCLHGAFQSQVARTPDAVAVVSAQEVLTYAELNARANRVARRLRSLGAQPEDLVAICGERSIALIVSVLGVLKSGAAYVPLNPFDPPERLSASLRTARPKILLSDRSFDHEPVTDVPGIHLSMAWPDVDGLGADDLPATAGDINAAYVIFTSGSTGAPKGVTVSHRSVTNHLAWMLSAFPLDVGDRTALKYPVTFDAAVCEIFCPLLAGATLVIAPPAEHWDVSEFIRLCQEHELTALDVVPSMLEVLLREPDFAACRSLRRVICGGEVLRREVRDRFFAQMDASLHNIYGPTEATIGATSWTCRRGEAELPIGRPIANVHVYILDASLRPVPIGARGEIYIGGEGIARGYVGDPQLTAERFLPDPFSGRPGARIYRTGDLAWFSPDGALHYADRVDGQVKIRGNRVETRAIETVLARHDAVQMCAVVPVRDDLGHKRLVAYVLPTPDRAEFWPSVGDYGVYDELLYYALTHDEQRNEAYRNAIARSVTGKVVLDLGTGADAILARFCADAGARRVYALEVRPDAFRLATAVVEKLALVDQVTVLHGDSMSASLPEPVDVCVSELIGMIGSSEGVVSILNDARRFLADGGTMIPRRCVTKIAPVALPDHLAASPRLTGLPRLYAKQVFEKVGHPFDLRVCVKNCPPDQLLAEAAVFEDLDFSAVGRPDDSGAAMFTFTRASRFDGFLLWLNLYTDDDEMVDSLYDGLSWLPVFFPAFHPGVDVSASDVVEVRWARTVRSGDRIPDYELHGTVDRIGRERLDFAVSSCHDTMAYRDGPFYDALFGDMDDAALPSDFGLGREHSAVVVNGPTGNGDDDSVLELGPRLRRFLQQRLPEYMIPSSFVVIHEQDWPSAGKLDRRALAARGVGIRVSARTYLAPSTETEAGIAAVWREVLNLGSVGVHDNFFDLGGDSLLIAQVRSQLERSFGMPISIIDLFRYPTIAALATFLDQADAGRASEVVRHGATAAPTATGALSAAAR